MTIQENYFRINCIDQTELFLNCFVWNIAKATLTKIKLAIFKEKVSVK